MNKYLTPPPLINSPVAADGDYNIIPSQTSQKGIASLAEGFPPETAIPFSQGGSAAKRLDMNGLFYMLSSHTFWQQSGGLARYNTSLDYLPNNLVVHNNTIWVCRANNGPQNGGVIAPGANANYWKTIPDYYGLATNSSVTTSTNNLVRDISTSGNIITVRKQNGSVSTHAITLNSSNWTLFMGRTGWARENTTGFTLQWGRSPVTNRQRVYFPRVFSWAAIVVATEVSDRTRSFAVNDVRNDSFSWWPSENDYCHWIATGVS